MLWRTATIVCFAGAVLALAHRPSSAQGPRVIQVKPFDVNGTVAAVRPGGLTMKSPTGEAWGLRIPPNIQVRVTGKAHRDVLKTGLHVRFLATVDKRRSQVQGKVEKLTIIAPSKEDGRMPGVFLDATQPMARPAGDTSDDAADGKSTTTKNSVANFDIRARIVALKGNWMTLQVPNEFFKPKFRVELAEELEIGIDVSDYTIAKSGDKVTARGVRLGPQMVQAMAVQIELANPLGKGKKRPGGKKPGKKPAAKPSDKKPGEEEPGEDGEPVVEKPNPDGNGPKDEDAQGADAEKLVQFLKAKPEEAKGKVTLSLRLNGVDPEVFNPCTAETAKNLRAKFGKPKKLGTANGTLPVGEKNAPQEVRWQLWDYGPVKILVDEVGDLRYFSVKEEEEKKDE